MKYKVKVDPDVILKSTEQQRIEIEKVATDIINDEAFGIVIVFSARNEERGISIQPGIHMSPSKGFSRKFILQNVKLLLDSMKANNEIN